MLRQCVCSSVQTDSLREFSNSLCLGGWSEKSLEPEREACTVTYCAYCDYDVTEWKWNNLWLNYRRTTIQFSCDVMTHFMALKRNNLFRGTLEHIKLASYLFNSPYLLHYNNWSDQDYKFDCMVEDRNVWKNGECTLVLWKSRRVERLKENSMWSWLRRKFQIWFWKIVISACRIVLMGGHGKEQLLRTSGRRTSLKDKQEERI